MHMSDDSSGENEDNWVSDRTQADKIEIEGDGGITSLDEVLDCLTSSKRRILLYYLQDNDIADVDELVDQVAAREEDVSPEEVTADHRQRVETQLVHTHLPKLADAQFIEYDRRSSTVRYTEPPSLLRTILRLLARVEGESNE